MADGKDDDRYEHQFEDLNGRPDDDDTVVDLGDDQGFDAFADDDASREAAGDDDAAEGADDDAGSDADDAGAGAGEGAADDAASGEGQQADDLNSEIDALLEQQQSAARDQEIAELRRELADLRAERQQDASRDASAKLDEDISAARQRLIKAQEEGDTEAAATAQDELIDLRVRKGMSSTGQGRDDEERRTQPRDTQPAPPQVPEAGKRWVQRNLWFYRGENPQAAQTAQLVEKQLRSRGFDPNSDAMYDEIDRQLARVHPELGIQPPANGGQGGNSNDAGNGQKPRKRRSAPTNGMGSQGAPTARSGRVTITAEDRQWMERCGMDPENEKHIKEWARNKQVEQQRSKA